MSTLIVTGASRGIGAATAILAAKKLRHAVVVGYQNKKAEAQKVVAEIEKGGGTALAIQVDTGEPEDIARLFAQSERSLGPIVGLVNNAAVLGPIGPVSEVSMQDLARVWAVNITGYFAAAQEAVARMSTKNGGAGGSIVNVTSVGVRLGGANEFVPYAASKGAIHTFTLGLAREVANEGIRVNGVEPGLIDTGIHAPGRLERIAPTIPIARAGTANEVAEAIVWLLSDAASYACGSVLTVAGGR